MTRKPSSLGRPVALACQLPAGEEMAAPDERNAATKLEPRPRTRLLRLGAEVRQHPIAYTVLAFFILAGPVAATLLFPEAPHAATIIGGLVFGGYAALCAVPGKFL